jgi:predicted Zn-dependent peptidase
VETVSVGAYVSVGTRHETPEDNGVSHFLEHMAFKGTARRDAAAIAREIENVGGHLNAYTAREQTAYYAKVLKEDTALAVDIIGDILTHSTFVPEEVERERGVILQEIGQANDTPDDIVFDHFQSTAFPDQPMGRPVLGTEDSIKAMTRDALKGYMGRHYGPSSMVIAGAGALEHETLLDLVGKHFADLPDVTMPAVNSAKHAIWTRCILCWAFLPRPIATPCIGQPRYWARFWGAACLRACFRKSVKSVAWFIPSMPSLHPSGMAGCSRFMPARVRRKRRN